MTIEVEDKRIKVRRVLDAVPKRYINWYDVYRMKMYDAGYAPPGDEVWI